jgi:flavin-dependent dehydrogenase
MFTDVLENRYDVVIAGARCAGSSLAMLLAREGLSVLVVDPLPRGRDTLSTHALMRGATAQLQRWGLLDAIRDAGTPPIRATTFDYEDETLTVPIEPADGVDALFAPRRTLLDTVLSDAAEMAGATVARGIAVTDVLRDGNGRVRGVTISGADRHVRTIRADLVVGADGVRSRVARLVGAPVEHRGRHATASVYGYWVGGGDAYHWYFRPRSAVGVIPTNGSAVCVFASVSSGDFATVRRQGVDAVFREVLERTDSALAERLMGARQFGTLRAFAGIPGFLRRPVGPGWALVGDAGFFRDPLTAHGITDALRDAELLARAVAEQTPDAMDDYRTRRDQAARQLADVTDQIASMTWSMEEVKMHHRTLSRAMKPGLQVVRGFDATKAASCHSA